MLELFHNGGPVMYPLLGCSVLVLTIIIDRLFFWALHVKRCNQALVDDVLETCRAGDWQDVRRKTSGAQSPVIRVLVSGIVHREFSMTKAMEMAALEEIKKMRRGMATLDTMVTVAPLLGILGTVLGIIVSFDMLSHAGIDDPRAVTGGIAQALITTATGLTIAIVSVIFLNFFQSRIGRAVGEMEQYATSLEIVYEKLSPEKHIDTKP